MSKNETGGRERADRPTARVFLRALGGGVSTFQTFDDCAARKDRTLARVLHGTIEEHFAGLECLNNRGAGIFVTVNRTDGKGRERNNIVGVRAVFVDLDGVSPDPVLRWALVPHLVVESSPSRFHGYWLVDQTVALTEFTGLQKKLAKLFGGDPKVHDLSRVMRLPGFVHRKGDPFRTRLVGHNIALPRYSYDELDSALAGISVNVNSRSARSETPAITPDQPGNVSAAIQFLTTEAAPAVAFKQGNNCTYQTACAVRARFGISELTCYDLMVQYFNPRCAPPWSLDELEAIVAHAYRYGQGAIGDQSAEADFATDPLPPVPGAPMQEGKSADHPNRKIKRRSALRRQRAMAFSRE
jgi:hypothetical protein